MIVFVNNEQKELQANSNIEHLLKKLELSALKGMAVAVNQEVISKSNWANHLLHENDKVTIIRATQGG